MSEVVTIPVDMKQTWDDDCEQIVIEHSPEKLTDPTHVHHRRLAIIKKSADSITIHPMFKSPADQEKVGHEKHWTYVRTKDFDNGRAIFRQGVA